VSETGTITRRPRRVRKVDTSGIITTIAGNLEFPGVIAVDRADNVFVVNNFDQVTRIAPDRSATTVFTAPNDPFGVDSLAVDASGNLYVGTSLQPQSGGDAVVMRLDPSGKTTVVAGSGQSAEAIP